MVKGTRIDFYLPKDIVNHMDRLVEEGYYLNRSEMIRDAMRHYFRKKGIGPFGNEGAEKPESSG